MTAAEPLPGRRAMAATVRVLIDEGDLDDNVVRDALLRMQAERIVCCDTQHSVQPGSAGTMLSSLALLLLELQSLRLDRDVDICRQVLVNLLDDLTQVVIALTFLHVFEQIGEEEEVGDELRRRQEPVKAGHVAREGTHDLLVLAKKQVGLLGEHSARFVGPLEHGPEVHRELLIDLR